MFPVNTISSLQADRLVVIVAARKWNKSGYLVTQQTINCIPKLALQSTIKFLCLLGHFLIIVCFILPAYKQLYIYIEMFFASNAFLSYQRGANAFKFQVNMECFISFTLYIVVQCPLVYLYSRLVVFDRDACSVLFSKSNAQSNVFTIISERASGEDNTLQYNHLSISFLNGISSNPRRTYKSGSFNHAKTQNASFIFSYIDIISNRFPLCY